MREIVGLPQTGVDRGGLITWMKETIERAEALPRDQLVRRTIAPAGMAMEVLFDDAALAAIYLPRLATGDTPVAATQDRLYVLTSAVSKIPAPLWEDADFDAKALQAIASEGNLRAAYPLIPRFWQFYDVARRVGIQLVHTLSNLPKWDAAAPLRRHLHWLLEQRGLRLTHAATLGLRRRGLLILGKGRAGKSSTTLAGLTAGLSTVGDDYVALADGDVPSVRLLYRVVKQDRQGLGRIPGLAARLADRATNWQGKVEFDPLEFFPDAFAQSFNLAAVMVPHIAHAVRPSIAPIAPSSAMLSLMSTNLHQHIGEPETGMVFFGDILRKCPCFRIDLAVDALANGTALRQFLDASPQ